MSTVAIDTASARSNERLTAFLTEIGDKKPIDQYFSIHPAIDLLMDKKVMKDGGRQVGFPIGVGENPTVQDFGDADVFDTTVQDAARWTVYPYVNKGGSLVMLGEETREQAGSDHKIFDLMDFRRDTILQTVFKKYSEDLFAASAVAGKISPLTTLIDSTGSVGDLNASTESSWAANETASGSFAAQGLSDMRGLYNDILTDTGMVDVIITTQDIFEYYENEVDPDVRYKGDAKTYNRGVESLTFKGKPITYDPYCTAGVIYMWDSRHTFLSCDTGWNFDFEPFISPANQKVSVSKFANRCNLVTKQRRTTGKLTGITA